MKSFLPHKGYLDTLGNIERKKYLQKVRLVKLLHAEGPKSNADIYRILNISSPTSLILLHELLSEGLIEKKGKGQSIGGRKPELYCLCNNCCFIVSISIERFSTEIAILDNNNNNITGVFKFDLKLTRDQSAISQLYAHATNIIHDSGIDIEKLVGVGVSMPGLINGSTGQNYSFLYSSDEAETLQDRLEALFNRPVYIQNDVNTSALAELRYGLAAGRKDVLVLLVDWGIGMGIIMDGKLQRGVSGFAGAIGHMPFINDGELCYCGKRGCLETVASGLALARMAKEGIQSGETSLLNALSEEEIENIKPQIIVEAANKGDEYAITILSEIGQNLGRAVAGLIQLFNPELIILGGKLAEARQYITIPINQAVNTHCGPRIREHTKISDSTLDAHATHQVLADLVLENILDDQIDLSGYRSTLPTAYSRAS